MVDIFQKPAISIHKKNFCFYEIKVGNTEIGPHVVNNMSIWLIAIIAFLTIFLLFYSLEQCSKFLAKRNHSGNPKRKRSRLLPVSKMATIVEQHVSFKNSAELTVFKV